MKNVCIFLLLLSAALVRAADPAENRTAELAELLQVEDYDKGLDLHQNAIGDYPGGLVGQRTFSLDPNRVNQAYKILGLHRDSLGQDKNSARIKVEKRRGEIAQQSLAIQDTAKRYRVLTALGAACNLVIRSLED